jgi:hypothetical protein
MVGMTISTELTGFTYLVKVKSKKSMLIEDFLIIYLYWPAVPVVGVCEIEEIARPYLSFKLSYLRWSTTLRKFRPIIDFGD